VNETVTRAPAVVGASATGASHVRDELPCQDAFAFTLTDDGIAIAVADGLGSASSSDRGAHAAVDAAVEGAPDPIEMVARARAALERLAEEDQVPLRDLACTLLCAVVTGDTVVTAHIGDGAIVGVSERLVLVSGPEDSEYLNEVTPLTANDWTEHVRTERLDDVRGLAVFTDGLERAAITAGGEPHPGFFDPLFSFVAATDEAVATEEIERLLGSATLGEHSDDDKTLVIAWLPPRAL
jgi:hypothetical protein